MKYKIEFFANLNAAPILQDNLVEDELLDIPGWVVDDYWYIELREDPRTFIWSIEVFEGRGHETFSTVYDAVAFLEENFG